MSKTVSICPENPVRIWTPRFHTSDALLTSEPDIYTAFAGRYELCEPTAKLCDGEERTVIPLAHLVFRDEGDEKRKGYLIFDDLTPHEQMIIRFRFPESGLVCSETIH